MQWAVRMGSRITERLLRCESTIGCRPYSSTTSVSFGLSSYLSWASISVFRGSGPLTRSAGFRSRDVEWHILTRATQQYASGILLVINDFADCRWTRSQKSSRAPSIGAMKPTVGRSDELRMSIPR